MAKSKKAPSTQATSKTAQLAAMLRRTEGATISQLCKALNWQPHSVRGAIAGQLKKRGFKVTSLKEEGGERTYWIQE